MADRLQLQRLELKYLISEEKAQGIREFVRSYLDLDENADPTDYSYNVHSLYLDSDDLRTYWWTINGNKNRFKLRIRFYSSDPQAPVFLEIKRRMNEAILKSRAIIRREAVAQIFQGQLPGPEDLVSSNPRYWVALQRFCQLVWDLEARPKGHVTYRREAWVTTQDNSVRVTMDRRVRFKPQFQLDFSTEVEDAVYPFHPWIILELKFTGRYPNWLRELVHTFNLQRSAASKYCNGIETVGVEFFYEHARNNGVSLATFPESFRKQKVVYPASKIFSPSEWAD